MHIEKNNNFRYTLLAAFLVPCLLYGNSKLSFHSYLLFFLIGVGNITACAEFNFYFDPEAAFIVTNEDRITKTILPWEPCVPNPKKNHITLVSDQNNIITHSDINLKKLEIRSV